MDPIPARATRVAGVAGTRLELLQMVVSTRSRRSIRVTVRPRVGLTVLTALLLVGVVVAPSGHAGISRLATPKQVLLGCDHQVSSIPLPAAVVSRYLPEGFSPLGPEGHDEIAYVSVGAIACLDDPLEEVQLTYAFIWVKPPKNMERRRAVHIFVLDAIHRGSGSEEFVERFCLDGIVPPGDQIVSIQKDIAGTGISRTTGLVMSDALTVRWQMATFGAPGQGAELTRWFFGPKGETHVDMFEYFSFLGVGESSVVFEQPYLDLPPASVAPSWYKESTLVFRSEKGCP